MTSAVVSLRNLYNMNMKKAISFYLLCCLSTILMWLVTSGCDTGSQDFRFGFHLLMFVTVVLPTHTIYDFLNRKLPEL